MARQREVQEQVFQAQVSLPNGHVLPISLSVKERWQTRDGMRIRARLGCPEKERNAFPSLTVNTGASLESVGHQASVCVDSPLGVWEWNVELGEGERQVVALLSESRGVRAILAAFAFDFQSMTWKQVQ